MRNFPTDVETREQMRIEHHQRLIAEAERKSRVNGRALKCAGVFLADLEPRHADEPNGCDADATACICACHDFQPAPAAQIGA